MFKFNMRDSVKDSIAGFAGVVTARTEYLNGCLQYCVRPTKLAKEGALAKSQWFDEQELELVKAFKPTATAKRNLPGGPRRDQASESPV